MSSMSYGSLHEADPTRQVAALQSPDMRHSSSLAQTVSPAVGLDAREPAVTLTQIETPLGPMAAAATDEGVCLLEYTDPHRLEAQMAGLRRRVAPTIVAGQHPHLEKLERQLGDYFAGALR